MKRLVVILLVLILAFATVWAVRLRTPLTPADPYADGTSDGRPWWETAQGEVPTPDADWVLDPEIPQNYVPVLGGHELYMVVKDGMVEEYCRREKQEDGSWVWTYGIDPNIPENFEPVEGLDDVYKVTDSEGNTRYYRYTRNKDDTYFFTEVDENGTPIQKEVSNTDSVPANFIRIEGTNIYAVYNEYGVLIGYKERIVNEDGSYTWIDAEEPPEQTSSSSNDYWGLPGLNFEGSTTPSSSPNVTIVSGNAEEHEPYTERESITELKHEDGMVIVYETVITRSYDEYGKLISTKSEGPTVINKFPETEFNKGLLP